MNSPPLTVASISAASGTDDIHSLSTDELYWVHVMKKLPTSSSSIVTPREDEAKLKGVLSELCVVNAFDEFAIHELYLKIGQIYGAWLSEQEAAEVSPVANALRLTARNLLDASTVLSGLETGLRTHVEIEATRRTAKYWPWMRESDPSRGHKP